MNKTKKLITNTFVLSIGNMGSKIAALFLVPLYTHTLSKDDFGFADVLSTTIAILTPIFAISIADAVFRFSLDKNEDKAEIFSNGLVVTLLGAVCAILVVPIVSLFMDFSFTLFLMLSVAVGVVYSLLSNFMKVTDKVIIYTLSGIISTIVLLGSNILFLMYYDWGLNGYFVASLLSGISGVVFISIFGKLREYIKIRLVSFGKIREMLAYSLPLIPNAVSWWLTNDANRIIILIYVGAASNGLYAVANKIPAVFSMFFSIFSQAWQISAIEEFESNDRSEFYSSVLTRMIEFSMIFIIVVLYFLKDIMAHFVSNAFYDSWKFVPLLLLTVMYSNISSFIGTTYLAAKKTVMITTTTFLGMFINIFLGLILVKKYGVQGIIFAGFIGFMIVTVVRLVNTKNIVKLTLKYYILILDHVVIVLMILLLFYESNISLNVVPLKVILVILMIILNSGFLIDTIKIVRKRWF